MKKSILIIIIPLLVLLSCPLYAQEGDIPNLQDKISNLESAAKEQALKIEALAQDKEALLKDYNSLKAEKESIEEQLYIFMSGVDESDYPKCINSLEENKNLSKEITSIKEKLKGFELL
ncbi:MAG: hypothetical protein HQL27_07610, partial [Candidatus Omnitrophica bacterium]|nr:hypothetical protein [Candidatus Omnitrophota bacterium]